MSKRLVLSDSDDDVDYLKTKKRFTIAESDDDDDDSDDDNPCYDVVAFNETRRKLRLCGFDEIKATEITIGIYSKQKLTPSPAINVTVDTQSTAAERTVSFDEDAPPVPAFAAACYDVVAFNKTRRKLRICGVRLFKSNRNPNFDIQPPRTYRYRRVKYPKPSVF